MVNNTEMDQEKQNVEDVIKAIEMYINVSPLGPLREAYAQVDAAISGITYDALRMDKPVKTTDSRTSITFEILPTFENMSFIVKEVKNIKDGEDLPPTYRYGKAAFYMAHRVYGDRQAELCIYTPTRTKWIEIGVTRINTSDLQWIIKTMKKAGEELTELNKKIAKVNKKAGRTFTVKI